ncbi:helicase, partial [Anaerobutyricum soehngenii]|nr:helicase [Anaerobutyricum soehngenii]
MLEPCEGKLSRTVLRGESGSNTADLLDQLIENKQKFIGQIMTSKSPVRSCQDVDEAALSY